MPEYPPTKWVYLSSGRGFCGVVQDMRGLKVEGLQHQNRHVPREDYDGHISGNNWGYGGWSGCTNPLTVCGSTPQVTITAMMPML